MTINERIQNLRWSRDLTLWQLAKLYGCSAAYICQVENGKCNPKLRSISKFAIAFGITIPELMSGVGKCIK